MDLFKALSREMYPQQTHNQSMALRQRKRPRKYHYLDMRLYQLTEVGGGGYLG
jgi:hypothetical protein